MHADILGCQQISHISREMLEAVTTRLGMHRAPNFPDPVFLNIMNLSFTDEL